MIPASPLVSCSDGNKSNKKNNPRPRKKSDKPKKPKINKVVYNIPVTTECSNIHGLNKQPLQTTSVKILSPAPTTKKINKLIELPSTPLKPSEALKHMTNSPTISTAPPIISTSLSLTTTPQFTATIPSSPLISRQVIQHPGIKAAGLKSVASIPHLVCPPSVTHSGKLVTPSPNLIILNQHLDSSKVKCPITIKKPIVCTSNSTVGTPQATISYNPSKELLPTRSLSSLTPETIKLVNKYLPKNYQQLQMPQSFNLLRLCLIFVTSDTKASSSIGSSENEGPSSIGRFGSSTLSVDEDTLSSSPKLPLFEADILEEDFEDMEYKPYAKKSKPAIKNKRIK
ncbi:unnamed protein product [Lepeophtheirus salmonis]|uniref:(salmon louse) hypothetical protein n=1 Tax=Lepeophtheirus salmonis TaxID=72036 RepID=A0A7R8D0B1_LEPSM|nr:unnamed protein product [Lepeophtheirus salmonis]CAF2957436.1 unnamed protein product [Lepeophtheirus salmonis]